ncbi:hypothetical protein [Cupriavidus basilensis]|uniref:hypothetical protein n=1 Tax=Cupriavidus basilensis TaxID=68895 RepID=UPI00157AAD72|nr:hypothetical protein [Cupriavidus basilensis]NUA26310.1 hypothetical protein [Cupriavidus basilensis]
MHHTVATYSQRQISPPEAFSKAIGGEFLARIKLTGIPVIFLSPGSNEGGTWGGFCSESKYTERGEIAIHRALVEPTMCLPQPPIIRRVYLHEASHRLMEGHAHNAAFFAMNLVFLLRSGNGDEDPDWHYSSLYDLQDEAGRMPEAFAWGWKIALELASSELSADECARSIESAYCAWEEEQARREERIAEARERRAMESAKFRALQGKVNERWWFALCGGIFGVLLALALRYS